MNVRTAIEAGTALYVRLVDPATGASGFLPISPSIKPDSALRFHRGRPPHSIPGEASSKLASARATPMVEPRTASPSRGFHEGKARHARTPSRL